MTWNSLSIQIEVDLLQKMAQIGDGVVKVAGNCMRMKSPSYDEWLQTKRRAENRGRETHGTAARRRSRDRTKKQTNKKHRFAASDLALSSNCEQPVQHATHKRVSYNAFPIRRGSGG